MMNFTEKLGIWMSAFQPGERKVLGKVAIFRKELAKLEEFPIQFDKSGNFFQEIDFSFYQERGRMFSLELKQFGTKKSLAALMELERDLVALNYRLEKVNGGWDREPIHWELLDSLLKLAGEWKLSSALFHDSALSYFDIERMQKTCQFPHFATLVIDYEVLMEEFFNWTIRDQINPVPFIQYPNLSKTLVKSHLNGRIGRVNGEKIRIVYRKSKEKEKVEKIVVLPFEGQERNILNPSSTIFFRGGVNLSIAEIFKIFEDKDLRIGNLEYMADGVVNWNAFEWGYWNVLTNDYERVDIEKEKWWEELPLLEVISLKTARQRYGEHLDGVLWNAAFVATRLTSTLDYKNSHVYTTLAIPTGDGSYVIVPMGKYAKQYPQSSLEVLTSLGETQLATVAYPDDNFYYTHRQRAHFSFPLTEDQGMLYLSFIKKDMKRAQTNNLVYQIESENCAKWSMEKMEDIFGKKTLPNLFEIDFLKSEPQGLVSWAFAFLRTLSSRWQRTLTTLCHFPMGAHRGVWVFEKGEMHWKALTHHTFWIDLMIYLPARLYQLQELGIIGRFMQGLDLPKVRPVKQRYFSAFTFFPMVVMPKFENRRNFLNLFLMNSC